MSSQEEVEQNIEIMKEAKKKMERRSPTIMTGAQEMVQGMHGAVEGAFQRDKSPVDKKFSAPTEFGSQGSAFKPVEGKEKEGGFLEMFGLAGGRRRRRRKSRRKKRRKSRKSRRKRRKRTKKKRRRKSRRSRRRKR
tara:strand:+ start:2390 stop:2797 length:408 start_codon:yes stop_codon:yes gene_type:complete